MIGSVTLNLNTYIYTIVIYIITAMVGVIDGFRWCLLGTDPPNDYSLISLGVIVILFITSKYYFKRVEKKMADLV